MRNLQTSDLFCALRVVSAAGIQDDIKELANKSTKKGVNSQDVGFQFLFSVIGKLAGTESENEIYKLIGGILEIPAEEIKTMDPVVLIENIKKLSEVIPVEAWKNFFKSLLSLMGK